MKAMRAMLKQLHVRKTTEIETYLHVSGMTSNGERMIDLRFVKDEEVNYFAEGEPATQKGSLRMDVETAEELASRLQKMIVEMKR